MIDTESDAWSVEEVETAAAVFRKLENCQRGGANIPSPVYEGQRATSKNVNTEILVVDESGRFILNDRPADKLDDPYAGWVALTGVTHGPLESEAEALRRLIATELQGLEILKLSPVVIEEFRDSGFPRARYVSYYRQAVVRGEPKSPGVKAFTRQDLPWRRFIASSAQRISESLK